MLRPTVIRQLHASVIRRWDDVYIYLSISVEGHPHVQHKNRTGSLLILRPISFLMRNVLTRHGVPRTPGDIPQTCLGM
jgi:hypothetical protein